MKRRQSAFTLVELLVVCGIVAILIALIMPALNKARQQAKQVQCLSNLRQLNTLFQLYSQKYGGVIVPVLDYNTATTGDTWYQMLDAAGLLPIFTNSFGTGWYGNE